MVKQKELEGKLVAAVRIRGRVNVRGSIAETMNRLRLKRVNNCALIRVNMAYLGMLKKCTGYIAYGEVDEPTLAKLVTKFELNADPKAMISGKYNVDDLREKMPLRLHPAKHGLKSVKLHVKQGGDLGYRGESINLMINRMV